MSQSPLFPTSLVGSYSQPDWLINKAKLKGQFPPRTRAQELWRVAPDFLAEAQRDAVRLAVEDQIKAGPDIITDGRPTSSLMVDFYAPFVLIWSTNQTHATH